MPATSNETTTYDAEKSSHYALPNRILGTTTAGCRLMASTIGTVDGSSIFVRHRFPGHRTDIRRTGGMTDLAVLRHGSMANNHLGVSH